MLYLKVLNEVMATIVLILWAMVWMDPITARLVHVNSQTDSQWLVGSTSDRRQLQHCCAGVPDDGGGREGLEREERVGYFDDPLAHTIFTPLRLPRGADIPPLLTDTTKMPLWKDSFPVRPYPPPLHPLPPTLQCLTWWTWLNQHQGTNKINAESDVTPAKQKANQRTINSSLPIDNPNTPTTTINQR